MAVPESTDQVRVERVEEEDGATGISLILRAHVGGEQVSFPATFVPGEEQLALCLPGFGFDHGRRLWERLWPQLIAAGWSVLALEWPNGGVGPWSKTLGDTIPHLLGTCRHVTSVAGLAEGMGAGALLRALVANSSLFAPHHVIINPVMSEVPASLVEALDSIPADVHVVICERFYVGMPPQAMPNCAKVLEFAFAPENMGTRSHVDMLKTEAGTVTPIRPTRPPDWWDGTLDGRAGLRYRFSESAAEELIQYLGSERRVLPPPAFALPEQSALEMGVVNETFRVFVRARPLLEREVRAGATSVLIIEDIDFPRVPPPQRVRVRAESSSMQSNFVFDRVFGPDVSQDAVYNAVAGPLVADFLRGTNVTMFAYGQTGSGKTYTMQGPDGGHSIDVNPGIIPRVVADIFAGLPGGCLRYEYVQLYLEDFTDLLAPDSNKPLKLVEAKGGGMKLDGATTLEATSPGQLLSRVKAAAAARATRGTDMNNTSSRSHAVLILHRDTDDGNAKRDTVMYLVDLAGSERIARSGARFGTDAFQEATSINGALSALGRVVVTLLEAQDKRKVFIPYNSSSLTSLLRRGLGGESKTVLFACVTPAADSASETSNTLRFAMQASHVKNRVASSEARRASAAAAAVIEANAHDVQVVNGVGCLPLRCGEIHFAGDLAQDGPFVVILGEYPTGSAPSCPSLLSLGASLSARGLRWFAPSFPNGARGSQDQRAQLGSTMAIEALDYMGVPKAHVLGISGAALLAIQVATGHSKRFGKLLLWMPAETTADATTIGPICMVLMDTKQAVTQALQKRKQVHMFWSCKPSWSTAKFLNSLRDKISGKFQNMYGWSEEQRISAYADLFAGGA